MIQFFCMAEAARSRCMMLLQPRPNAVVTLHDLSVTEKAERTNLSEILSIIESYRSGYLRRRGPLRVTMLYTEVPACETERRA